VSICDGSLVVAGTGLLDGRRAIGHFASADKRREQFPAVHWVANTRFVHDGQFISSSGVSASLPTAIYLVEYRREGALTRIIRFGTECLAGVPSIIFGLFGFVLFVLTFGFGWSILAGGLTLAFMTLPTIIRTSEEALRAVPAGYREVSLSLGAGKWQTIRKVVLPAAAPGILTGLVLGLGRAIGETAAVIFTAGSSLPRVVPTSLLEGTRTLSVHFYQLAREGISADNAYATAAVLVLAISAINVAAYAAMNRFMRRYR